MAGIDVVSLVRASIPFVRPLDKGMGEGVAARTIFRDADKKDWGRVAARVAVGNCSLVAEHEDVQPMANMIATGGLLMSGRHLQHGDADQASRNLEVFSNCSTAAASFSKFYLLLNGSGVGRSYDDHMMVVDWSKAPQLTQRLAVSHPDFPSTDTRLRRIEREWSFRDAEDPLNAERLAQEWASPLPTGDKVEIFHVADSREGWALALEKYETMAFEEKADWTLCLVWDAVREEGAPIGGMQDRPASGPLSPMRAFHHVSAFMSAAEKPLWEQTMWVDHFFSAEVQVGGARRAARIAVKYWKDPGVIDFVYIKSRGGLWTANNSVGTDKEFWDAVIDGDEWATKVFNAVVECSFHKGEPGFVNLDQLVVKGERLPHADGSDFRSDRFASEVSAGLMLRLGQRALCALYPHIVNPCGEISLHLLGAYCVIADVAPALCFPGTLAEAIEWRRAALDDGPVWDIHDTNRLNHLDIGVEWDNRCAEAVRMAVRALIRANTMSALYGQEVARTNRIGVGLTGLHEYAWLRFGLTFEDICEDNEKSAHFWGFIQYLSRSAVKEAEEYARELGVAIPHTVLTMKPAGTTSKLFALSEGAHLAAMLCYLRWVQFRGRKEADGSWALGSDPLLAQYEANGYPVRVLTKEYAGMSIVGFPTIPTITTLGMPWVTTAHDATPQDQYKYIRLLEKYWLHGDMGNQVSYTMKIDTSKVSIEEYRQIVLDNQRTVRCCTIMPQKPASEMDYEYLPEEACELSEILGIISQLKDREMVQDIDIEALRCATGACPM